jgi:hypothetical protein
MKEENILCSVLGQGNTTIEFYGNRYQNVENQQLDFSLLQGHLELLRFKKIIFKYTIEDQSFTNAFSINSLDDTILQ